MDKDIPNLSNLTIASPCTALWSEMSGDEKARFCGDCKKHVYNLSEMSKKEAEALILEKEGKLCVRFYRRKDGTVLTDDCPVGLKAIRNLYRRAAACIGACISLVLSLPVLSKDLSDKGVRQGEMVVDPAPKDLKTNKGSKPSTPEKGQRVLQGDVAPGKADPRNATTGMVAPQPVQDVKQGNSKSRPQSGDPVPLMGAPAVTPQNTRQQNQPIMGKPQANPSPDVQPPIKKQEGANKSDKVK